MGNYAVIGGIAAVVDLSSFHVFSSYLNIHYLLATYLSFNFGATTNFLLSNKFVFDKEGLSNRRSYFRHYISSLGGLLTNSLAMLFLVRVIDIKSLVSFLEHESIHLTIAKVIATGVAFFVNFTLLRLYAFNGKVSLRGFVSKKFS